MKPIAFVVMGVLATAHGIAAESNAASPPQLAPPLSEYAASEQRMQPIVARFQSDYHTLDRFFNVRNGAERERQLRAFYAQWLQQLDNLPFDSFGVDDRIDWVMLRNQIQFDQRELDADAARFREAETLIPFVRPLIDLAEARRRMQAQGAPESAALLQSSIEAVKRAQKNLGAASDSKSGDKNKTAPPSRSMANRASQIVGALREDLKAWFGYYDGYDPQMSWWVRKPYPELDKALEEYAKTIDDKLLAKNSAEDKLNVIGDPIGRDGLVSALARELIPYTPEELMALAEKELAWGEGEMRKASNEMGFGDDWHKALEKVKMNFVPPGDQPAMVKRLAFEAIDYVVSNDLITVPELAKHDWPMEMMSPARQAINPFFLGGSLILVSYPTDSMSQEQKLMGMRGNNPHFSRAVVHHELIPGHHLQGFMSQRYQPQRQIFSTPFIVEGWAVYWEMLLYQRGFAVTPEDRIGMMFWRNHRAARILFSLGFHMGKTTPEQAVDMLVQRVGHELENARGEVRRSFGGDYSPLYQAGYMIGALQLRALEQDLVDGGKMSIKQYNDGVMHSGMLPIELIRARLKETKIARDFKPGWRFYDVVKH